MRITKSYNESYWQLTKDITKTFFTPNNIAKVALFGAGCTLAYVVGSPIIGVLCAGLGLSCLMSNADEVPIRTKKRLDSEMRLYASAQERHMAITSLAAGVFFCLSAASITGYFGQQPSGLEYKGHKDQLMRLMSQKDALPTYKPENIGNRQGVTYTEEARHVIEYYKFFGNSGTQTCEL